MVQFKNWTKESKNIVPMPISVVHKCSLYIFARHARVICRKLLICNCDLLAYGCREWNKRRVDDTSQLISTTGSVASILRVRKTFVTCWSSISWGVLWGVRRVVWLLLHLHIEQARHLHTPNSPETGHQMATPPTNPTPTTKFYHPLPARMSERICLYVRIHTRHADEVVNSVYSCISKTCIWNLWW